MAGFSAGFLEYSQARLARVVGPFLRIMKLRTFRQMWDRLTRKMGVQINLNSSQPASPGMPVNSMPFPEGQHADKLVFYILQVCGAGASPLFHHDARRAARPQT